MTAAPAPRPSPYAAFGPYRLLFPFGVLYALAGAVVWLLAAPGWIPYPGPLHRELMIEGFELSFITGFLLTAMIGFLHAPRATFGEVVAVAAGLAGFGVCAAMGAGLAAQVCALEALGVTVATLARRVPVRTANPPEEFVFVAFGLLCGLCGVVLLALSAAGVVSEPSPNFGVRLMSLGMVLSLVLGLGTLLVPPFAGIPRGLELPGLAAAHERRGRRPLYAALVLMLGAAFVADARWAFGVGAWLRALAGTPLLLLGWKVFSRQSHATLHAWSLRLAGVFVLAALWWAALVPTQMVAAFHVLFIGGFGLLTMAIATRVVVSHGRFALETERRVLLPEVVASLVIALVLRILAELVPAPVRAPLVPASGAMWALAWLTWAWRAVPLMLQPRDEQVVTVRVSERRP